MTALSSTDAPDPTPAYSLPTAGSANANPPLVGDAAFPGTLQRVSTYGTFTAKGTGTAAQLDLVAGQFLPSRAAPGTGTERLFNSISAEVYYLPGTSPSRPTSRLRPSTPPNRVLHLAPPASRCR